MVSQRFNVKMRKSSFIPISVIIASYNSKAWIVEAIESINKGSKPAEIIVVDDCSTDDSYVYVEALKNEHSNIRLLKTPTNSGAAKARLYGLEHAGFSEFCFVDADDLLAPDALELTHSKINAEVDICLFDLWRFQDLDSAWRDSANLPTAEVSGSQAFELTIGNWNAHAFGVYKKQQFMDAYKLLNVDCFNADEILTRIVFRNANRIASSAGRYYYRLNDQSITRGFNSKFPGVLRAHAWLIQNTLGADFTRRRKVIKQSIKDLYHLCKECHNYDTAWVAKEVDQFLRVFLSTRYAIHVPLSNPKYFFYFTYALLKVRLNALQ